MSSNTLQFNSIAAVALCIFMVIAVTTDIREHRIPNLLVVAVLLLGLIVQINTGSATGIVSWAGGLAVGMAIFLPFYIGGGMGAGDVKLMAATTGFLGPEIGFTAGASALIAGLPLAIIYIVARYLTERQATAAEMATPGGPHLHHKPAHLVDSREGKTKRIPYAAAIATGAMIGLWQSGQFAQLAGVLSL
jgi:prepilin peptidase CpaA